VENQVPFFNNPITMNKLPGTNQVMDTEFAKHFGATELNGVLKILGSNSHACQKLLESFGPLDGASAIEMIRRGELIGGIGDSVFDFFSDEIENEAEEVWSATLYDPKDEDNPDTNFPVVIREYCGVFFVWALEYDNTGYFLSSEDALEYVMSNWDNVRKNA